MDTYQAIRENRYNDKDIMEYLDSEGGREEKDSVDRVLSEDMNSELRKYVTDIDDGKVNFDFDPFEFSNQPCEAKALNKEIQKANGEGQIEVVGSLHLKLKQQVEKHKLRMYEELENLDYLIKNSVSNC